MAPANTTRRLYRMAMIAAMKKVLSPNSDTMMTEIEATKAWRKPRLPLPGSSIDTGFTGWGEDAFCKAQKKTNKQIQSVNQVIEKSNLAGLQ